VIKHVTEARKLGVYCMFVEVTATTGTEQRTAVSVPCTSSRSAARYNVTPTRLTTLPRPSSSSDLRLVAVRLRLTTYMALAGLNKGSGPNHKFIFIFIHHVNDGRLKKTTCDTN